MKRLKLLCIVVSVSLGCSAIDSSPESTRRTEQPIYNGSSATSTPEQLGIAEVNAPSIVQGQWEYGSGTFFDNRNLLTSRHVVQGAKGPGSVRVQMGSQQFQGTAKYLPPGNKPDHRDFAVVTLDKPAIINGNSVNFMRPLYNGDGDGVYGTGIATVDCYGYGGNAVVNGVDQGAGTLRFGTMPLTPRNNPNPPNDYPNTATSEFFWVIANSPTAPQIAFGDSGGPCLGSNPADPLSTPVLGVNKGISAVPLGFPPRYGFITTLGWWGQMWALMQARGIAYAMADFDVDGAADTVAVTAKNGFLDIEILFDNEMFPGSDHGLVDFDSSGLLGQILTGGPVPVPAPTEPQPILAAGDFNGNGAADILAYFGGQVLYYDGQTGFMPTPHVASLPVLSPNYALLRSADFDGDGFADAEAVSTSGAVDVYYGSQNGLTTPRNMMGFPTADGNDGRYVTVTGEGNATVAHASMGLWLAVHPSQTQFNIEIFDGGMDGSDDTSSSPDDNTCFSLYKAPGQVKGTLVKQWDKSYFAGSNNGWRSLGWFPTEVPSGESYDWYLLEVKLGTGNCNALGAPAASINPFKVRMTLGSDPDFGEGLLVEGNDSDPSSPLGQVSFRAVDAFGPSTPEGAFGNDVLDTTYDGTFGFLIYVGDTAQGITITEGDADYLLDGQKGACQGYSDPIAQDPAYPGVATGANPFTSYSLQWWNPGQPGVQDPYWDLKQKVCDPSGQYTPGAEENESRHFDIASGEGGWWSWVWDNVWVHNNILVFPVTASPAPYAVFGKRPAVGRRAPIGASKPIEYWMGTPSEIASKLPITVGTGEAEVLVTSLQQASAMLNGYDGPGNGTGHKVTVCHHGHAITVDKNALPAHLAHGDNIDRPRARADLLAQLLTAKLNVQRCSSFGQDLASAFVYGREETVADVLAQADGAVLPLDEVCSSGTNLSRWKQLTALLRAVNSGTLSRIPRTAPVNQLFGTLPKLSPLHVPTLTVTPPLFSPNWPLVGD